MRVYKGTYQSRPVAVHVLRPRLTSRDGWRRVRSIVIIDPTTDFILTWDPEILQSGRHLETPSASEHPSIWWCHNWPK